MDAFQINKSELDLLEEIARQGGEVRSLFHLAVDLVGVQYNRAHNSLNQLEKRGLVSISHRRRGSPMHICLRQDILFFLDSAGHQN
jgi:hypothetical protein